ncbi:prepilin-type N-terminal cleavage/methylation domain-containing protein [Paenibacillus rhizophilus]|uniref:Prepilin-type N-terminal cleavage/methylation domain-containing protein n=1 Tax=Paenibacillus rhizophilus TaxID=1850366 RepID=A0A3N9P2X4_9BACL|nr:prepilin-type N-terminal cleavage/methylation domain-containing protein [Paenibacillus rhizophilus]RQW10079.1 prepilin-type N-terminal cleavage/methylation domain-containing protein [Paenibacillus rhizophilus]
MRFDLKQERGFTLIEVLAAIVILSIVSLVLTSYFVNAMSYSKSNQNKTIMVNLARNALFYMEKQDFEKTQDFFVTKGYTVSANVCQIDACGNNTTAEGQAYRDTFDTESLASVLHPRVNGVTYTIDVVYQSGVWGNQPQPTGAVSSILNQSSVRSYLLPVKVEVRRANTVSPPANTVEVEGYITDERIR